MDIIRNRYFPKKFSLLVINRQSNDPNYNFIFDPRSIFHIDETFRGQIKANSKNFNFRGYVKKPTPDGLDEANLLTEAGTDRPFSGALFFIHLAYDIDLLDQFVQRIVEQQISPFKIHVILPFTLSSVLSDYDKALNQFNELKEKYSFIEIIDLPPVPAAEENWGAHLVPIINATRSAGDWTAEISHPMKNAR